MGLEDVPIAFFSYCREDSEFALKLAADLKVAGAHVWIDQLDIEPGTPWDRAVEDALTNSPHMLVVLSPVSVKSDNVRDEVSFALSRQKRVIPVLYRDCDVPFRLARLQHIDFRADYTRAMTILMRALGVGQGAHAHGSSGVADAVEAAISPAEAEEQAREQKLEEEHRLADEQAQLEDARKHAAEQSRLKKEREAAAQAAREKEQQRTEAEARANQEQSRREQRAAEQARLAEEARLAAERVRLAQQEKERREAEIKARQEQLRREEQESIERKSVVLKAEQKPAPEATKKESPPIKVSPSKPPATEPARPPLAAKPAAAAPIEPLRMPAAKATPPRQAQGTGVNLASPKYLAGGAAVVVVLVLIIFLLAHRGGPEKAAESNVAESKAAETAAIQQPQTRAEKNPSESPAPETQSAAAPANAPNPEVAGEKPRTGGKEVVKAKNLSQSPADQSNLNPAPNKPQLVADAANAPGSANAAPSNRPRISQGVSHGLLMSEVAPKYPPLARSARVQGQVVLDVVIGKDGAVRNIVAKSGHPLLVPGAIDAVKQWRYQPYKLDGKPVDVNTEVVVNFTLTN